MAGELRNETVIRNDGHEPLHITVILVLESRQIMFAERVTIPPSGHHRFELGRNRRLQVDTVETE
jgi:hypothetical protein